MVQHQGDREHGRGGVGHALARDVGGRAWTGSKIAGEAPLRVDEPLAGEPETTGHGGREIREDAAEQVVGDDDVEALRVGRRGTGRRVDVLVAVVMSGTRPRRRRRCGSEPAGVGEHVGLPDHRETPPLALWRAQASRTTRSTPWRVSRLSSVAISPR